MKKLLSATLTMAMLMSNIAIGQRGSNDIQSPHHVFLKDNKTGKTIDALAGLKIDPADGKLKKYRTFTDPSTGNIIEQYVVGIDKKTHENILKTLVREKIVTTTTSTKQTSTSHSSTHLPISSTSAPSSSQHLSSDSKTNKWYMIGAAVVGVVTIGFIGHAVFKSGKKSQARTAAREDELFQRGRAVGRSEVPAELRSMPKQIKLGADVPGSKGQTVNVAGGVPASSVPQSVPRFYTQSGQPYVVQQNPNTNLLETIFLYDMLTRPYYYGYPGAYAYGHFGYSPFMYDGGGQTIIYNETHAANPPAWAEETHDSVQISEATSVETSHVISETVAPESQSQWQPVEAPATDDGRPDAGSTLPEAVPEPRYSAPVETSAPDVSPVETYSPPAETYSPPAETYSPPAETYSAPDVSPPSGGVDGF